MFLPESRVRTDAELEQIRKMFALIGREPHAGQLEAFRHSSRYEVFLNGRRWGKTHLLAMKLMVHIQEMHAMEHPSPRVRIIAPESKQIQETLNYLRMLCERLNLPLKEYTNPRDPHLVAGRVRIEPRSGKNRETHRGAGVTFAVIDECSEVPGDLVHYAIRPSLTDYRGHLLMAGTPKGKNWVIEWAESEGIQVPYGWQDGMHLLLSPTGHFMFMRSPTWTNPYLPPEEIAELRSRFYRLRGVAERDLGPVERAFLQEYAAVILFGYERPFPIEPRLVSEWTQSDLEQMAHADWVLGVDYGFTAPSACVLAAYCPDGLFRVPYVGYEVKIDDQEFVYWVSGALVHKIGRAPLRMVIADPDFWNQTGRSGGVTLASLLERLGVPLQRGIRDRPARWRHLRLMLSEQRVLLYEPNTRAVMQELQKVRPVDPYGAREDITKPDHALTALAHATEYALTNDPPDPEAMQVLDIQRHWQQWLTPQASVGRQRRVERLTKARWD